MGRGLCQGAGSSARGLDVTKGIVEETARLTPGCTVVWYPGMGHTRAAMSGRIPHDILDLLRPRWGRAGAVSE